MTFNLISCELYTIIISFANICLHTYTCSCIVQLLLRTIYCTEFSTHDKPTLPISRLQTAEGCKQQLPLSNGLIYLYVHVCRVNIHTLLVCASHRALLLLLSACQLNAAISGSFMACWILCLVVVLVQFTSTRIATVATASSAQSDKYA